MTEKVAAQLWASRKTALTLFFKRHYRPDDAEDLTSECFVRLLETAGDDHPNPDALLWEIAGNLLVDKYRFDGRRKAPDTTWPGVRDRRRAMEARTFEDGAEEGEYGEPDWHGSPSDNPAFPSVEDQLFTSDFDEAVRGLDSDLRDSYILSELRGLPAHEIGPMLGVSQRTVERRLELARASIREGVSRKCASIGL